MSNIETIIPNTFLIAFNNQQRELVFESLVWEDLYGSVRSRSETIALQTAIGRFQHYNSTPGKFGAYEILISEEDRLWIVKSLKAYKEIPEYAHHFEPTTIEKAFSNAGEYLIGMFEDLPKEDQTYVDQTDGITKQMLNGFCL